jgi:hypothetical protein
MLRRAARASFERADRTGAQPGALREGFLRESGRDAKLAQQITEPAVVHRGHIANALADETEG